MNSHYSSGITIGFEQNAYSVQEALQDVEVCAEILQGSVQRSNGVTFTVEVQDGSAGTAKNLRTR